LRRKIERYADKRRNGNAKSTRMRSKNSVRSHEYGMKQLREMPDEEFRRMFRVTREGFNELLLKVQPLLERNKQKGINSSGRYIPASIKLAATLRWLAGGSYLDICTIFGLAKKSFYNDNYVLWPTMEAIDATLIMGFSCSEEDLAATAAEFASMSNGVMTGCVSALDGWVVKTRQPTRAEAGQSIMSYRNRKQMWGILVLAGCDARTRFNFFSAKCSGATHDYMAWEVSTLKEMVDESKLPAQYYFIGDEAFVNTNQFLVPWSGRGLGLYRDSFNYHLSRMRQCIERAFGIMTQRWGVFWRPLRVALSRWGLVCTVAAKLHNFCIDHNIPMFVRYAKDVHSDDVWEVIDNVTPAERPRPTGDRRRAITTELEVRGILRPRHAACNSRA
jgi:hypothetical protein